MDELGELFGILTIVFFSATVLNYVVKFINRTYSKEIAKNLQLKKIWMKIMRFFIKFHRYFGFAAIASLSIHFYLQATFRWVSASGIIAAAILGSQLLLGMYGFYIDKKRKGLWFITHRAISIALVLTILFHVVGSGD